MRSPNYVRISADYDQIELKVLAHASKDPIMVQAYINGEDIHERTGKEVGAILGKEIPRRQSKICNFGISYCLSAKG